MRSSGGRRGRRKALSTTNTAAFREGEKRGKDYETDRAAKRKPPSKLPPRHSHGSIIAQTKKATSPHTLLYAVTQVKSRRRDRRERRRRRRPRRRRGRGPPPPRPRTATRGGRNWHCWRPRGPRGLSTQWERWRWGWKRRTWRRLTLLCCSWRRG